MGFPTSCLNANVTLLSSTPEIELGDDWFSWAIIPMEDAAAEQVADVAVSLEGRKTIIALVGLLARQAAESDYRRALDQELPAEIDDTPVSDEVFRAERNKKLSVMCETLRISLVVGASNATSNQSEAVASISGLRRGRR